jgi:hypothetical protein
MTNVHEMLKRGRVGRGPPESEPHADTKPPRRPLAQLSALAPPPAPVALEPPVTAEVDEDTESGDELPGAIGTGGSIEGVPGRFRPRRDGSVEQGPRPFEEGRMAPPQRLSGPDPAYTLQALEHDGEGTMFQIHLCLPAP